MKEGMFRYALALAGLVLAGSTALAQYPYTGAPVAPNSVQAAQEKLRRAEADTERLERESRERMQKTPEYAEARQAADTATRDRDKARDEALSSTRASQPYIKAQEKLQKAEQTIAAGNRREASSRQVTAAASDAIDARLEISKLESDALSKSISYRDAELRLKAATARLDELWQALREDELANNRAYRAAVTNKQMAEEELKVAQESMRVARQQMAAQQQAARPQRSATPRSSRSSGGGGRRGGY